MFHKSIKFYPFNPRFKPFIKTGALLKNIFKLYKSIQAMLSAKFG